MDGMDKNIGNCSPLPTGQKVQIREIAVRLLGIVLVSLLFSFFDLGYSYHSVGFLPVFLVSLARTALIWHGSMVIIEFSARRYSIFTETFKIIIFQVVVLSVFVFLVELAEIFTVEYFFKIALSRSEKTILMVVALIITFMISAIYASVAFFIQWKENLVRSQTLQKANLEARYDTLRNQLNPHFLFNSLNTLLMLVADNPVALRYVESISEIMRYMLQTRDKETVPLEEELKIARDYIFVQQSRFGDKLKVEFNVPEKFNKFPVPPLAIQMLLENAIKHNVISSGNPLYINVFAAEDEFIVVENSVREKKDKEPSTGIGLENIQNRYLHLTNKKMAVKTENEKFTVMLPLFENQFRKADFTIQ
jgi:sensor histidine kinase YesM